MIVDPVETDRAVDSFSLASNTTFCSGMILDYTDKIYK